LGTVERKTKEFYIRLSLVGLGVALLFAALLESILFLEKWTGFVAFGVDTVTYYGLNVFTEPAYTNLALFHNAAFALIICSLTLPPLIKPLRKKLAH